jgi:hypothetical protein
MQIKRSIKYLGKSYQWVYQDSDDFSELPKDQKCQFIQGICYCNNKLVIFCGKKNNWVNIGNEIKPCEASVNELKKISVDVLKKVIEEELNTEVIKFWPVGFDYSKTGFYYHLYYVCLIKPLGKITINPASVVKKIALINPKDYKKYINSDTTCNQQIERSLEIIKEHNAEISEEFIRQA